MAPKSQELKKYLNESKPWDGMGIVFGYLKEFYQSLDEDHMEKVLFDVVQQGKDLEEAKKFNKNLSGLFEENEKVESPKSISSLGVSSRSVRFDP